MEIKTQDLGNTIKVVLRRKCSVFYAYMVEKDKKQLRIVKRATKRNITVDLWT